MNKDKKTWSDEVDEGFLHAVIEGKLDRVKYYADKGADVNQMDDEGRRNPLRLAAIRSHFEIVKYLVEEKGVKPSSDKRVLHMTVMAGDHLKEIFLYLVKHGANINGVDEVLGTPLMLAIRENSDFELAKWLISVGADITVKTPLGTALHNAVEHGTIDQLDYLLTHGGDKALKIADSRDMTPLMLAASKAKDDVIKFLVEKWHDDINFITDVNPLLMAVQNDHIDTVRLLCELGADVNVLQPKMKCYPLHLAASNNFKEVAKILLKFGAKVDCPDPRGYTPLFMAGSEGYDDCCKILLDNGANPNHRSEDDYTTTIFHAARCNRLKVVRLLLDRGAEVLTTKSEEGDSIADMARKDGHTLVANLIDSWIIASAEERQKICAVCFRYEEGNMKRCSRCKGIWYCSSDCQKKDWNRHKYECKPAN